MYDLKTRVLVVDDMLTMRKVVSKMCKEIGFTDIVEAADGAMAWDALTKEGANIGVIVSDWNMPNCSGLELLKKVRSHPALKQLPFMMVTAESEQSQVVEAVKAGVTNYIIKPFTHDTFVEKMEQMYKKGIKT